MTSIRSSIRTRLAVVALGSLELVAPAALAQGNSAMAESLFREGKKLMAKKDYAEACPKFAESARLDASSGVQLALGICYEGQGKTASAWGAYVTAASLARRDNRRDREKAANERAEALESKLSHVTIDVAKETAQAPGLDVKVDSVSIGVEAWQAEPLDPGDHKLDVTATGKRPFATAFTLGAGETKKVLVPVLQGEPGAAPLSPPSSGSDAARRTPHESGAGTMRAAGFVAGGAGIVSLAVGSVVGLMAVNKASSVNKACPTSSCSDAQAVSDNHTAGTLADVSTVAFIAGGAGAIAGGLLLYLARHHSGDEPAPQAASVKPIVLPGYVGLGGFF